VKVFYSPDYVRSEYAFETTRKAKWIADSLVHDPIAGIEILTPRPLSNDEVLQVHTPEYVEAVRTGTPRGLAESQGFPWNEGLWPMVLASNGGVVEAALAALEDGVAGSLSSGLHHAHGGFGKGFCTFNGLVMAARAALGRDAKEILILDLDAHCGGGTASLIAGGSRVRQLDLSTSSFDAYRGTEQSTLGIVENGRDYLPHLDELLGRLDRRRASFSLCIYNAGMDPFEGCPTGGLAGVTREILAARERRVFGWCRDRRISIAFVLAGGYIGARLTQDELVALHRLTLEAAVSSR